MRGRSASQDGIAERGHADAETRPATQPAVLHGASTASSSSQPLPRPPASQPLLHGEGRDATELEMPALEVIEGNEHQAAELAALSTSDASLQQQPHEEAATRMDIDEPTPAVEEQGDQRSIQPEPEPPLQAPSFHIDLTSSQATSILEATPPPAALPSPAASPAQEAGPSQPAAPPQGSLRLPPLEPSSPPPPRPPTPTPPQVEASAAGPSSSSPIPAALLQPSPPRRNLRTRKPGQLHPYTVEMALYKRRLERNDWEDAVVTDHHMRRRMREERERQAANELPIDGDGDEEDGGVRREREEEKKRRREEREDKRRRRDERRRREAEEAAREAVQEESQAIRGSGSARRTDKGKGKANEAATRRPNISTQELFARFGGMVSEDEDDDAASQAGGATSTPALAARGRPGSAGRQYGSRRRSGAQTSNGQEDGDDSDHSSSSTSSPVPPSRKRRAIRSTSASSSSSSSSSPTRPHRRPQAAPPPLSSSSSSSSSSASASASSADEQDPQLDLDRYFKQLKRMMPVSMARKYIADLRSMRKGKAYHSDGHESDTPEPSSSSESSNEGGDDGADMTMTPATSPADAAALRPGEARKRQGLGRGTPTMGDARFELVGDSDSESEDQQSIISVSSSSDDDARAEQSQAYDGDIRWWAQPEERGVRAPRREEDAIDRMLSRAVGAPGRPAGAASKRRSNGTGTRRARAAGGVRSRKRRPANQSSSTALRDRELNRPASSKHATTPQQKQSTKRKRHSGTTSRTSRPSAAYRSTDGPQPRAPNPPVVQPRARRMLDLRQDDVLFDVELLAQPPPPPPRPQGQDSDDDDDDAAAAAREAREYAERVRSYREQSQVGRPLVRRRLTVAAAAVAPPGAGAHTTPAAPPRQPIARTESRDSATSSKSPSIAHSSPPPLRKGQGLRPFLRVSSRDGGAPHSKTSTPPQMSRAQLDANSWADLTNLRLDFGIRPLPAGRVSFGPSTAIGRGRLFELVELGKADAAPGVGVRGHTRLAGHTVLGVDLPAQPDVEVFVELMPQVFDAIYAAAETIRAGGVSTGESEGQSDAAGDDPQAAVTRATHGIDDLLRYLAQGITSLAEIVRPREVRQYVSSIKAHLVHLFERFQAANAAEGRGQQQHGQKDFETLLLKLRWFDVETSWRHIASKGLDTGLGEEEMDFEEKLADEEEMVLACEGLMISL